MSKSSIAILFGGRSSEHEISLRSAAFILKNIPSKYNIIPVGISREGSFHSLTGVYTSQDFQQITTKHLAEIVGRQVPKQFDCENKESVFLPLRKEVLSLDNMQNKTYRILNSEASCVFPVLHGPNGEDGRLQGLLELAEIAYVGCDIRSSVIGIDKDIQKRLAREAGIPVAKYEMIEYEEYTEDPENIHEKIHKNIGYPCFVKPNALGSAVGANKVKNEEDLKQALDVAFSFDQKILVEELLVGTEVECAFLGTPSHPRVTCGGEIATKEFYSYQEKYNENSEATQYIPARLSETRMEELKNLSIKIAKIMGITGFARIDFWNIPKTKQFIFNEYNTIPGLTSISMFPKLWDHCGVQGATWIEEVVQKAYKRKDFLDKLQFGITSNINQHPHV